MTIVFEGKPFKFEYDAALEHMVREFATAGTLTIQAIIDKCAQAGFDGRAVATEIGIQLMDGVLRSQSPTGRLSGATIIEIARIQSGRT